MVHSLGLTLYNLRTRRETPDQTTRPDRPPGRLIWLHAPSADTSLGLLELARRLIEEDGFGILMTCDSDLPAQKGMIAQPAPGDSPLDARAFLDHWQPELGVFSDGELRPSILHEAAERGIPLILVDGRSPRLIRQNDGWYPGLMRSAMQAFRHVVTLDEASARAFRRSGALLSGVQPIGRLEEESAAPPCLEAERAALARLLATRPVWLAAGLPEIEEHAVITAHRAAQNLAHRLLLIIAPETPERAAPLSKLLAEREGWIVGERGADEEPEPDVDVYVADGMTELGLWYRLAPITFLGGSLHGTGCVRNPMEAASLGSAILHGPRPGRFGGIFGRLGAARAARAIGSSIDLGEAVSDLLSPDRAAKLAQAAWDVATEGADVTEHVIGLVRTLTDGGA